MTKIKIEDDFFGVIFKHIYDFNREIYPCFSDG